MVATRLRTAEEFETMPDPGDGRRYELVRGEVVPQMPTGFEHLQITGLLIYHLNALVVPGNLGVVGGEGGFILERGPDTVRAPDVVFVRTERVPQGEAARHFVELAPDLAIEVRSPSESLNDLRQKADEYLAAGSRMVWIFDPLPQIVIVKTPDGGERTLNRDDELDGGEVLPGFTLRLSQIFRNG
jgi:Uma2 family endonuclease